MAQDNTPLYLMLGVLTLGALYLTKQFCPNGALPTDAFDGKLCYAGGDGPVYGIDDKGVVNIGGAGTSGSTPANYAPGYTGGAAKGCGAGFAYVQGACVCNTTYNRCPAGYGLYNNKTSCGCGNCKTAKCPTGSHSVVGPNGVGCICVKNAGTVTGGTCNKVCTGGYVKNNNPCSCVCNSIVHKCGANATARGNGKTCSCYCNNGYVVRGNTCVKSTGQQGAYGGPAAPTAVQVNNAKLFLADVINRTVTACTGRNIGTTAVVQGYPSAISSLAKMNNYSQNKILAYNNRPFAQTFRSVVMAIVGSYKLNLSPTCTSQMSCLNSHSLKECGLL